MKSKVRAAAVVVAKALASKEARGPELALARLVLAALGIKLGVDFADYVK